MRAEPLAALSHRPTATGPPAQAPAAAVFSGVLLGYVAYDCMHYLMHRWAGVAADGTGH